jgi:transposase
VVTVEWDHTRPQGDAFWAAGLFANQNDACPMRSSFTINILTKKFLDTWGVFQKWITWVIHFWDGLGVSRGDLSAAQWAVLEPLLPVGVKPGRPPKWSRRQLIDGIRWRTRTGAPWRDVPERYGAWETVYGLFRRWQRDGTWAQILAGLQARADAQGLITWEVNVDSTIMRAHQHAAGARKGGTCRKSRPAE